MVGVVERLHLDPPSLVGLGMFLCEAQGDFIHLRLRLLPGDAGFHPRRGLKVSGGAGRLGQIFGRERERNEYVHARVPNKMKVLRQNAHHRVGLIVKAQRLANDSGVVAQGEVVAGSSVARVGLHPLFVDLDGLLHVPGDDVVVMRRDIEPFAFLGGSLLQVKGLGDKTVGQSLLRNIVIGDAQGGLRHGEAWDRARRRA